MGCLITIGELTHAKHWITISKSWSIFKFSFDLGINLAVKYDELVANNKYKFIGIKIINRYLVDSFC